MKKFLTLMIGLALSLTSFAQYSKPIEYPKFEVDSNGQQVLVMTIEQAQALDNATDLLVLLERLNTQMGDYDSICVKVINDKDKVIASQKMEIAKLKESLNNKDEQIKALQGEVASYLKKIIILEGEVSNRQKDIETLGWRFLRYFDRIPSLDELQNDIDELKKEFIKNDEKSAILSEYFSFDFNTHKIDKIFLEK